MFADDQRADTIAAWGNRHIKTPNLDTLVANGFSFRNNYCFGSNSGAVCVPSRAMLMSGRTWFDVKPNLDGAPLLPEVENLPTQPERPAHGLVGSGYRPKGTETAAVAWE